MSSKRLSCKECCMQFTGPVPYMDHLQSARHRKKVGTLSQTDASVAIGGQTGATNGREGKRPSTVLQHPLPFACKLCNMSMNCETALIAHNKGKRHQRALKSQELFGNSDGQSATKSSASEASTRATSSVVTPPRPQSSEEGLDLSCEYCGIVLFKNLEYKLKHLETEPHYQNKCQAEGKRGSDYDECDQPQMKRPKTEYPDNETAGDPNDGYYAGDDQAGRPSDGYYAGEGHPEDPNDGFYPGQYQ